MAATQRDWDRAQQSAEAYISQFPSGTVDYWAKVHDKVSAWIGIFGTTGRLLDAGCRKGEVMRSKAFPPGIVYCGIDPLLMEGFEYDFEYRCETLENTTFPVASFDFVLVKDAIDCFLEPRKALASARRLLKPGGHLLITEDGHPMTRAKQWKAAARAWLRLRRAPHEGIYPNGDIPTSEILKHCRKAGFSGISVIIKGGRLFLAATRSTKDV